jgi:putative Holliday junction resolvase
LRACAVDFGDSRTGVAFSDISRTIVGETVVVREKDQKKLAQTLAGLFSKKDVGFVAVGLPVNMDGSKGPRAEKAAAFAALLGEVSGLPVTLIDERKTTEDAHRILSDAGVYGPKRKNTVDAVAASLILEIFLKLLKKQEDKL